eukprot:Clim_evm4s156 gene=Clim_evmTU4s156
MAESFSSTSSESGDPQWKLSTQIVTLDKDDKDPYNPASVPIYQSATFKQTSATQMGEYDYSRSGNPTRTMAERHLAKLCAAKKAFLVSSGMTALDIITRLVNPGQEIIAGTDVYGGTNRLLTFLKSKKIDTVHVDTCDTNAVERAITPNTRMLLLETPTNPLIRVCDLRRMAEICKDRGIITVVDNTMMSEYLQRPLELGLDIVYHSGTKYLSGHHDLMAGVIATADEDLAQQIYFCINAVGCGLPPFDCWLLLRGIKTLSVRLDRQEENAMKIANWLVSKGLNVNYPGLKSHPDYELHWSQARGAGAVLSFTTGSTMVSQQIVEACRLFSISVSFGCVNSLISMPCRMSHASIPAEVRKERALPEDLIRLCIGIEDADDLIADLEHALIKANVLDE